MRETRKRKAKKAKGRNVAKTLTRKRKRRGGICPNVDTVEGVRLYLAWSLRKMIAGELSESKAKGGAYIAGVLLRACELASIEKRITELEQIAMEKNNELQPKT
jgi:hypothetical protein